MPLIKPFTGLRPAAGRADDVVAPPYDVMSTEEAREMVKGRPWSFLHISRPEVDLPEGTDPYSGEVYSKAAENLAFVMDLFPKLADLKDKPASTLSGGEARMLAIGRGIMSNPQFLAVDEPSLGLAPNLRTDVVNKINEIRNNGVSILLVEQSTHEVVEIADYLYLMEDGRIVFEGSREEIMNNEKIKPVFLGID